MTHQEKKKITILLAFAVVLFGLVLWKNLTGTVAQHFSLMAESFNHGRLDLMRLDPIMGRADIFFKDGKAHWANFPFPAIILMPFVFVFEKFGLFFYQGYLQFFLTIGVFWVSFLLAKKFKFTSLNSLYLAIAVCFGSNYSFVAFYSDSWYYSQPVVVLLTLLALYEWYSKKRLVIVGTLLGLILATRITAEFVALFFVLEIWFEKSKMKEKLKRLFTLGLPIIVTAVILLGYNQARFGSPWETGYSDENISPEFQVVMLKKYGLFKLVNIPTNIYWNFLAPPMPVFESGAYHLTAPFFKPNGIGMSFFIMSPIFLLIFKTLKKPSGHQVRLWLGSLASLIPLLMWYSTGYWQVGARYFLDFFGLWYALLLTSFAKPNLTFKHRLVIVISSILNVYWILPTFIRS